MMHTPESNAKRRQRYATDPDFRQAEVERVLAWQRANPDKMQAKKGRYRSRLPQRLVQARERTNVANNVARRRGVPGRLRASDLLALWERQPDCVACGEGYGLDHIIPMGRGGPNTPDNIQNLCLRCNQKKHLRLVPPGALR